MASYHHTDTLGQAIEAARSAHVQFRGALVDLDRELAEERHAHRVEVARLVERAETAESDHDALAAAARQVIEVLHRNHSLAESRDALAQLAALV